MKTATKPLLALTADDLMTTEVVTIPRSMSLRHAAHMLHQADISGAPVVDGEGRCVGVLSAHDFISWIERGEHAARQGHNNESAHAAWQIMDLDVLPTEEVWEYMTADVVTATPDTPIGNLARRMLDAHVHRVIVVDEDDRPIGIVTSTDVLAAVAGAAVRSSVDRGW
jgi:CBS domain-containing protein